MGKQRTAKSASASDPVMSVDVAGRIRNTAIPKSKPLLPLFEAIVNAIDSIHDSNIPKGTIQIIVHRESNLVSDQKDTPGLITGFDIVDNGSGFTKKNYESFMTADSMLKASKGAKGIGRFGWLVAYNEAQIESIFSDEGTFYKRTFSFLPQKAGIHGHEFAETEQVAENFTKVSLVGMKADFQQRCPITAEAVARRIVSHCLPFFIQSRCPQMVILDGDMPELKLDDLFEQMVTKEAPVDPIAIKNQSFEVAYYRICDAELTQHVVHFCAHGRSVVEEDLRKGILELSSKVESESSPYVYAVYVSSSYLDDKANQERTGFNFIGPQDMFEDDISLDTIRSSVHSHVRNSLSSVLAPIKERKSKQIQEFIYKNPQYYPMLKHGQSQLEAIAPDLTEDKLAIEVHKAYRTAEIDLMHVGRKLLDREEVKGLDPNQYRERLTSFIDKYGEFGQAQLAQYVAHRKLILEFFDQALNQNEQGKYNLESYIHDFICPLKVTSQDVQHERMNLWIVDERLSYHRLLASDLEMKQIEETGSDSKDRADVLIYDQPIAFSEDDAPFQAIVIIEFKKPMRGDYTDDSNPINQVFKYIGKINEGKVKTVAGRPIDSATQRRYYCYIIADLTPHLCEQAEYASFTRTADSMGYIHYNKNLSAYVEIISYSKLLQDSFRRNKILFEKLGIPTS